ncbi:arylsulfatase [Microbacterium oryzae]|uniref:arylsulfatase n=1 Tax=Microbacterium oryzae TaxID=743009 RepID=UPI0025B1D2A5|nr:arylsulfatase [Microbacterium oryzae]MDN3310210.1 arylsulfatase [Microbacterium oryzae]
MAERTSSAIPEYARGYEEFEGSVKETISESRPAWPAEPTAREGSPNVIVMLVDDMGYADIGPFGSEIDTPNLDRLAERGVRMTNYHTTPVCSPARAALLTGINPHRAGFSTVAGFDPGFPGSTFEIADDVLTLPEILRGNGYSTFMVGKWHLSRGSATNDGAAKDSWPLQRGFDRYYGCLEGFTPFMAPNRLIRDNSPVEVERYPDDYYLTDDLTDEAIGMIRSLRAHDAKRPFFLYFAHHAMHAPFAAKKEDMEKYRGRYDAGWDEVRARRFDRQRELGVVEEGTRLPERNHEGPAWDVPAWDEVSPAEQAKTARIMEVYAAMVDNLDQNLGRLMDALEEQGELDNTIIVFTSDNGGANDGGRLGTRSYLANFLGFVADVPEDWTRDTDLDLDLIGGPQAMVQYPRGWAMASNTPFRLYKGSTFAGGVRTPVIVSWPEGLRRGAEDDGFRRQYAYVTDLSPTILDLLGIDRPAERCGAPAKEPDGQSFAPVLTDPVHPAIRTEQYSEFSGHRGFYRDGWKALTLHRPGAPYEDTEWQLFDTRSDPTEIDDIAGEHPGLVAELAQAWQREAWRNTVFPLGDASGVLTGVHRPSTDAFSDPLTLYPGTPQLERERSAALISMRSFEVRAAVTVGGDSAGVLFAHGDQNGGYVVYVEDGTVHFEYNEYGIMHKVTGPRLAEGAHEVVLRAEWRPGMKWDFDLALDGSTESATLTGVQMMIGLAPYTGIDVGIDRGGPVSWSMHQRHGAFRFSGKLHHVAFIPGEPADHNREEHFRAWRDAAAMFD